MFYDKFVRICTERCLSPSRAAIEAGLSKSTVTKWKTTPDAEPTGTALRKLSEYFGVSVAELLADEAKKAPTDLGKGLVDASVQRDENIIRIAGRDGSFVERRLTDSELAAFKAMLDALPEAPDNL